ncbi:hypothetical protein L9F63_025170 [Diploptera punctata]|uniref:Uncharacterized protein n=1 Tax=Diploptera punctata TaxID=6984 RepID=A0AAD7ZCF8_DIPPU|nr:hypothetical protein L9F63_025170 [Diploptera punctata]
MEGKEKYVCPLDMSSVCAKWTNYFDNEIVNVTYFCTRIQITNEGSMTAGCLTHYKHSYSAEVCACRSTSPHVMPCNYANRIASTSLLLVIYLIATVFVAALVRSTEDMYL